MAPVTRLSLRVSTRATKADTYPVVEIPVIDPYTPGSGPPPKKPGLLPSDDKRGVILGVIWKNEDKFTYIVGHKDHPASRHEVSVLNISNYVSNRELEEFTKRQDKTEEGFFQRRRQLGHEVREAKRAKRANEVGEQDQESHVETQRSKRKTTSMEDEHYSAAQPPRKKKATAASLSRVVSASPSVSNSARSSLQRGLSEVESESEFEEESTAVLIAQQLRGLPEVQVGSPTAKSSLPGPSTKSKAITTGRNSRSSASTSSISGNSIALVRSSRRRSSRLTPPSVAATSSMDAAAIWETLEKQKGKGKGKEVM